MEARNTEGVPEKIGSMPVLFSTNTPPELRKAYVKFIILCAVALAMIIWPVASLFNRGDMLLLGLPVNLLWIIFWKASIFAGLVWLYRFEYFREGKKGLQNKF